MNDPRDATIEEVQAVYMAIVEVLARHRSKPMAALSAIGQLAVDISKRPDGINPRAIAAILIEALIVFCELDATDFIGDVTFAIFSSRADAGDQKAAAIVKAQRESQHPDVTSLVRSAHVREPVRRRFSRRPR